jgi:hypothetical protein
LHDVAEQRTYWRDYGPPLNVAVVAIAASLGVNLLPDAKPATAAPRHKVVDLDEMMINVDLGEVAMPVAGGDTMEASRAILEKLQGITGG